MLDSYSSIKMVKNHDFKTRFWDYNNKNISPVNLS